MLFRLTHFTTALVFLLAVTAIYQNVITPRLQPPVIEGIGIKADAAARPDESLHDLFAEGSWQRGQCKQLQTSDGMLLFEKWEQTADDQWKLWPVTVVIGRGMSGVKTPDPVILEASEGAEITFTESLDVLSGGAPPIQRGRLLGPVHIYRRSSESDQSRSLDLRTANVGIDNRKLWTTEAIDMRFGQARLLGRDLTIHLSAAATAGGAAVLDRMELIYLDELTMPLKNGGLWESNEQNDVADGNDSAGNTRPKEPALISIACGGRVEYDFALDHLSLRESVSLVHQIPGAMPDRFDCEILELKLNDPTNDAIERQGPLDWLNEIVARGAPAVAKLPSFDTEIAAEEINFNAAAGLVVASGSRGIRVRRGGVAARLAKLVYQYDPAFPEAIGAIDAEGAGIVTVTDPELPLRRAQWTDGFQMRPVDRATADDLDTDVELMVRGDVHAWLADGGEFEADRIEGVLSPDPTAAPSDRVSLVPNRFRIQGDVRIDTAAIAAETQNMILLFVAEANPQPLSNSGAATQPPSSLRQWVVQPGQQGGMTDPVARPRPTIRGDTINAELRRNAAGLSVKQLSVESNVEVVHSLEAGGQMLPARLTGQRLRLIDGGGADVLELGSGAHAPARFEFGDGFFVGPQIQIRPSDNIVWINAAGEFQIPTAALPSGISGNESSAVQWIKPPHCRWQGEMLFDGRTVVLSDGVDIDASLIRGGEPWEMRLSGDRLQVDLLENVQLRDMQTMRNATVQKISLLQANDRPVTVQAMRRAVDGVLEAKHLLYATRLTMTPAAGGKLVGEGPGWYRGWMIPKSTMPKSTMPSALDANSTLIDSAERSLTGIHLVFHHSMQADVVARSLDFLRGVRVGVRAVSGWDEAFDAAAMDVIAMGDSTLDCDQLRFTVEPAAASMRPVAGMPTPWEMEATSGVVFRTRNEHGLLEGTAARASYSSSKDLFTVDGAPNRAAIFRQTRPDGQPGPEGAVRTMSIRPQTMEVDAIFERLSNITPPNLGSR